MGFVIVGHFHKTKASGLSSKVVVDHLSRVHFSVGFKRCTQTIAVCIKVEPSNKNVYHNTKIKE